MKVIKTSNANRSASMDQDSTDLNEFNLKTFSELNNYKERMVYCGEFLRKLGMGSSRTVYEINDKQVLKIAKNVVGMEQNETEANALIQQQFSDVVTYCYEAHQNFLWVVMERAQPMKPTLFKQLSGLSWKDFQHYMHYSNGVTNKNSKMYIDEGLLEECDASVLAQRVVKLCSERSINMLDVAKLNSWGMVERKGIPVLVLVDYGDMVIGKKNK